LKETCHERGIIELCCDLVVELISHQLMGEGAIVKVFKILKQQQVRKILSALLKMFSLSYLQFRTEKDLRLIYPTTQRFKLIPTNQLLVM
jgi:hypothetical protein